MAEKTESSGSNHKLSGKVVYFREPVSVMVKTNEGDKANRSVRIPKGTVGILTGGFVNKKINNRLTTFLDVKVILFSNCAEFSKKYTMLISVALGNLKFNSDITIN